MIVEATANEMRVLKISKIRKRDGKIVPFNQEKITEAIWKAVRSVGGSDKQKVDELSKKVIEALENEGFNSIRIPTVEDVQNFVEKILIENGHAKTAKSYILYRQARSKIREEAKKILNGRFTNMYKKISLNSLRVLAGRYLIRDTEGNILESPEEMFSRVARALAEVEKLYGRDDDFVEQVYQQFYEVMYNLEFLPAGRTIANAGASTRLVSNCIVLHFDDSMKGIFETLRDASLLQQAGSGLGFPFHLLRPAGSVAVRSRGMASGPVSFLKVYDKSFGVIKQQGRHGANMAVMSINHPDVLEFINCKAREGDIRNFNISVSITDDFMQKIISNDPNPWMTEWKHTEMKPRRVVRDQWDGVISVTEEKITPREIMDEIATAAWRNGEPGVIFIDAVNKTNPVPALGSIEACNPCGEQFLHDGDVCNLGSINLEKFVTDERKIDWDKLAFVTRTSVRMLDNVIDITDFPVEKVNRVFRGNRRVGLGIMGFADMLIKLRIAYNSEQGRQTAEQVMSFIETEAVKMSQELAEEKGVFPNWHLSTWAAKGVKMRNAALTTIAPTGSISMICDVSSGVEPYFALVYQKSNIMGGQSLFYANKHLEKELTERGIYSEELMKKISETGSVRGIEEIPEEVRKVFTTALDISPEDHVLMQSSFQKYIDNSISKTINLPADATKEDVLKAYILAWKSGCKSITVYRASSRQVEVLHLVKEELKESEGLTEADIESVPTTAPVATPVETTTGMLYTKSALNKLTNCMDCSSTELEHTEGCVTCKNCGWSVCSL